MLPGDVERQGFGGALSIGLKNDLRIHRLCEKLGLRCSEQGIGVLTVRMHQTHGQLVVLARNNNRHPLIDLKAGGSLQAIVQALNHVIETTVPAAHAAGGTLVVPGHGRISDHAEVAYYRDMTAIVRDRIQDMIRKKMTLEQIKAARPTRDYDARYGRTTGAWTTDMFVEAAYRSLMAGTN